MLNVEKIYVKRKNFTLNMALTAVISLAVAGISKGVKQMNNLKKEIDNLESDLNDTRSEKRNTLLCSLLK